MADRCVARRFVPTTVAGRFVPTTGAGRFVPITGAGRLRVTGLGCPGPDVLVPTGDNCFR